MARTDTIKKCLIYSEMSSENQKKWFGFKPKKFISHIDTFYYTIYPDTESWKDDIRKEKLIEAIRISSANAAVSPEMSAPVFEDLYSGLTCGVNYHFNMYAHHFCLKDAFDVFIADFIPNKSTPPVFVQLRSNGLWLQGVKSLFDTSLDCVTKVLSSFGLGISKIVENRIDYAYHTNYIQEPIKFFPEASLKEMQVSQFQRWHKEGDFFGDEIRCDYFTLGRRKSNNVFFRVYNKSKEVIEMGYKQFFIPIWHDKGLISDFDRYVLENTFMYGSWNSKERARCKFYLAHGLNPDIRHDIEVLMANPNTTFSDFKKMADKLVPDVTLVCNVEFQCKRKFFYNLQNTIPDLRCTDDCRDHIYSLLEQTKSINKFLTYGIIRFVRYDDLTISRTSREMSDWWSRLRSCKSFELSDDEFAEYCYSYQSNLDLQRIKQNTIKSAARSASYYCQTDDDLFATSYDEDFTDFFSHMTDNDIARYYQVKKSSFKDVQSKRLKLDPANKSSKSLIYARRRFESLFYYWFNGIYKGKLTESRFISILKDSFSSMPESRDLFIEIQKKHSNSLSSPYSSAIYFICKRCLEVLDNEKE